MENYYWAIIVVVALAIGYGFYRISTNIQELNDQVQDLYIYSNNLQAQITHGILVDTGPQTELSYRRIDPTETSITIDGTETVQDGSSVEVIENKNP